MLEGTKVVTNGVTAFTLCPNVHSYEAMAPMNNSASVADDYVLII